MPYVSNQGVRIHYEVEGSGTPLVLHHGTMGSYESWKDFGYVDALKGDHQMRSRALANDLEALLALTQDRSTMEEIPPTMTMPRLLFVGEADPRLPNVQECMKHLPNGTFFSLPECSHVVSFARSNLVLPHIRTFLDKVRS